MALGAKNARGMMKAGKQSLAKDRAFQKLQAHPDGPRAKFIKKHRTKSGKSRAV